MPLVSTTEADLNKEYLSKLIALQSAQLDARCIWRLFRPGKI